MSIRAFILVPALFCGFLPAQDGPETVIRGPKQFKKSTVITGLAGPWEITWGPDSHIWVTERTGKQISRVNPTTGERKLAATLPEVSAPGGQDGLLGMALHPELLKGTGNDYVYVFYTYVDNSLPADPTVTDVTSPYRNLYGKIVRLTYTAADGKLSSPQTVIAGLPAGNDHVAGRIKVGPDGKLYLTLGDQGNNQLGNVCLPVQSQRIPTQKELDAKDYVSYQGKSLRLNIDGSIPADNPKINGVVSHVYTYGHRNPQGIDFGPDGTLYASEQGPKTDDEVNILKPGRNYGWPHVVGLKDNKAYEFARWAEAKTPCSELRFSDLAIHPSVPREPESAFKPKMEKPLATLFTVPSNYNFADPRCQGIDFICWPTTAVSSIEYYASKGAGIPGWDPVLLVTTLKRGSLYVVPLKRNGKAKAGYLFRYFQSENRFRDTAVSPDGKTIYIATDPGGLAESASGGTTRTMLDKGSILAYTYTGEGTGKAEEPVITKAEPKAEPAAAPVAAAGGVPPQFSAAQVEAGKAAYNSNCAVCHGSTMTNGTFGTPLAGEYFQKNWSGRPVRAFYDKSQKTMPPSAPASLPADSYANIVAFILETNGFKAGATPLPAGGEALDKMTIK
jgi:PQQ-dependent dehydrogenase (s-GDH family)